MKKRCGVCGKTKDVKAGFYTTKRRLKSGEVKTYARSMCKECDKKKSDAWNKANREKVNARRAPEKRTPEELRKYHRTYYRNTKGKGTRVWKKYRHELDEMDPRVPKGPLLKVVAQARKEKRSEIVRPEKFDDQWKRGRKHASFKPMFDRPRFATYLGITFKELETLERLARANSEVKTVRLSLADKVYTALGLMYLLPVDYPVSEDREPGDSRAA